MRRRTTHPTGLFVCSECKREFGRIQATSRHISAMHPSLIASGQTPEDVAEKMYKGEGTPNPLAGPREQYSPLPGGRPDEKERARREREPEQASAHHRSESTREHQRSSRR